LPWQNNIISALLKFIAAFLFAAQNCLPNICFSVLLSTSPAYAKKKSGKVDDKFKFAANRRAFF